MEPGTYQTIPIGNDDGSARRTKLTKLGVVAFAVLFIGLTSYSIYNALTFRITGTNPSTKNVAAMSPFFKVSFNKQLSGSGLSLQSSGNIIASHQITDNILIVNLKEPLQVGHSYTITIQSIESTGGSRMLNKIFTFAPKDIAFSSLPKDQQDAINAKDNDSNVTVKQDPILDHLPYSSLDFILDATYNTQSQLILKAQLLIAPGVTGAQADADAAQYKQEVSSYIESLGLNPTNYTIQYQTVNETLTGP